MGVILSARTTGTVTQTALEAVTAFLERGFFRSSSIGLEQAVQDVAHAVSHCRFEPSDANKDEVVLLAILDLMYALVCGRVAYDSHDKNVFGESSHEHAAPRTRAGVPLIDMLGDEGVCELMETCLSMCCQTRLSTALRRTAERQMLGMIREIFSRLRSMPLEADEALNVSGRAQEPELATLTADRVGADAEDDRRIRMSMPDPKSRSIPAAGGGSDTDAASAERREPSAQEDGNEAVHTRKDAFQEDEAVLADTSTPKVLASVTDATNASATPEDSSTPQLADAKSSVDVMRSPPQPGSHEVIDEAPARQVVSEAPFGMPALKEILRVLISLLDPASVRHTMTMRLLGLSLLGALLDTHSADIARFPSLRALLEDSACRYLFQLANSEHAVLVANSLRVLTVLFDELRTHLKMQQELLIEFFLQQLRPTIPWSAAPWSDDASRPEPPPQLTAFRSCAVGEMRELFVEALCSHLAVDDGEPDTFVMLWRNYDCDMTCSNVYDEVTQFLCRAIFAQPAAGPSPRTSFSGLQLVALDLLLSLVERMAARHENMLPDTEGSSLQSTLRARRERKSLLAAGAAAFNHKPKDGIAFLAEQNLLAHSGRERARSIAYFLKDSPLVDKRLLGDYISRAENVDVLAEFIDLFDFRECDVAEAMRALCEAFRLPGEAQQIARVTETFARKYFSTKPPGIRSEDAVYVLAYSIIMLNTDLHNPQVTRRMSTADYQRNLRGVNDGADFDQEYLASIYDGIRRREIVMPEEHAGQLGFDYSWKELLRRARAGNELCATHGVDLDADMFRHSWRPFVASIVHAFSTLQDEHLLQRVIAGCRQCAVLARAYDVSEVFDYMVQHLASATGLMNVDLAHDAAANASVEHEGVQVMVSPLSIAFGSQFKQQLAAVVLFTIAHSHGASLDRSWTSLLTCIESLLLNGLLPHSVASMYESRDVRVPIPLKGKSAAPPAAPSTSTGLLSTLSSYFLSPHGMAVEPMDVSAADMESTLCTLDCLASCKLDQMHEQVLTLPDASLDAYLVAVHNRLENARKGPEFSPLPVFWLEQLASVAGARASLLAKHSARAMDAHLSRLHQAPRVPPIELERAVVGAMRLVAAHVKWGTDAHSPLLAVLQALRGVPSSLHVYVAGAFLHGLDELVCMDQDDHRPRTHPDEPCLPLVTEDEWRSLLHLMASYARVKRARTARAALSLAIHMLPHASVVTYAVLVEMIRETLSSADRASWHGEDHTPRRTLTEKREISDWITAVHALSTPALEGLASVRTRIPALMKAAAASNEAAVSTAWPELWLPLIAALAQPCVSVHRATRKAAVLHLQHVVLAPDMLTDVEPAQVAPHLDAMFGNILLPLLETLVAPETARADSLGPESNPGITLAETRTLVCLLVNRAWVRDVGVLMEGVPNDVEKPAAARVLRLWMGVVQSTIKILQMAPKQQPQTEAIDEQLKNMILVMHTAGHLVDGPPGSLRRALWVETWRRVDSVRPALRPMLKESVVRAPASQQTPSSHVSASAAVPTTTTPVADTAPAPSSSSSLTASTAPHAMPPMPAMPRMPSMPPMPPMPSVSRMSPSQPRSPQ